MLRIVASEPDEQAALKLDLDALVREGARRMLLAALKAEVDQYVAEHADHRDEAGHALVVRNGVAEPRTVTTAAGALEIQAPRVHDRREGRRFTSAILPPWARRSPKVTEVLPVLYMRGISTKDFEPALAEFFGSEAGLSAATIQLLTREWGEQLAAFQQRDLSQVDYVYLWADGVHFNIRLEHERLCCLVLVGVRRRWPQGTGRCRRRLSGVHRVLVRAAARSQTTWHAGTSAGHRRRRPLASG